MKLKEYNVSNQKLWEDKNYNIPKYDIEKMKLLTKENPFWIHFGAGNIFRALHASGVQKLLNEGIIDRGLIVVEGFDYEIIEEVYKPHDNFSILATLKTDGNIEKTVIGSIAESLTLDTKNEKDFKRLKEIFSNPSLQMATFTITEKGYNLTSANGEYLNDVVSDFKNGPTSPISYLGKVSALLYHRYMNGENNIAVISMDNCSSNGDKLFKVISTFAKEWVENNLVPKGFYDYVCNQDKVSFPWTMIDKITPHPNVEVEKLLCKDGVLDISPIKTSKNTFIAPFVNTEECEYLVIEDKFPNGKPQLEKAGFILTDRDTVEKFEKMKVCTCLNPLHTTLAIFGCLLEYKTIADEMKNETLKKLIEKIGYVEGLPVVVDPKVINPKDFLDTVINVRFPNPFIIDTPGRIASDTSQKLSIRFGETIKAYDDPSTLVYIPLVFAGWIRYSMGINDNGNHFDLSPDPLLSELTPIIKKIEFKNNQDVEIILKPILENEMLFGVNLYKVHLADKVLMYFKEMNEGVGAVLKTLRKYVV